MKKIGVFVVGLFYFIGLRVCFADYSNTYSHKSVCPGGGYLKSGDRYSSELQCWINGGTNFAQCNCTDYAAEKVNITNNYLGEVWSHGKTWNNAAENLGIVVDNFPIPGDIAYWDNLSTYGHVAFVEKVNFNSSGNAETIDITEYNYPGGNNFNSRTISSSNPDGFIHILAYEEGVTSLHYLDCYDMECPGQTKKEWGWILNKVWNNYRCTDCKSDYNSGYISTLAGTIGGMGGGPGYETTSTDTVVPDLSDFVSNKVWFETPMGVEQYAYRKDQEIKIKGQLKNVGDGSVNGDIQARFYLSEGYKEDPHNKWMRIGIDYVKGSNLEPGETHTETEGLKLWEYPNIEVGKVYNIVVCVDRTADQNNGDGDYLEEHESNNCSTEAIFTVKRPLPTEVQKRAVLSVIDNLLLKK